MKLYGCCCGGVDRWSTIIVVGKEDRFFHSPPLETLEDVDEYSKIPVPSFGLEGEYSHPRLVSWRHRLWDRRSKFCEVVSILMKSICCLLNVYYQQFRSLFFYDLLLFHQIVYGDTERTKVKHSHVFCDSLIIHGVLHPFLHLCIILGTTYNSFTSTPQNLKQKAKRKFIVYFFWGL